MTNKVTNLTLPSGETVEIQDPHSFTLDENTTISGAFDFGKITGAGNYNVPLNALNAPSSVSVTTGTLKVLYDHDKPIQVYLHRVTNQVFVRSLGDNGSWSDWADITATAELQSQIDTNATNISKETQDRVDADATLQSAINSEKTTRSNAVTTLQNNINTISSNLTKETNARTDADSTINTKLTSVQNTQTSQGENIRTLNSSVEALKSANEWKLLKRVTGQQHVTLPSSWNELYVGINITGGVYYTFYIPKIFATGENNVYAVNTYPSDSNGYCNISITATDYYLNSCTSETTSVVNSAISYIYYR